MNFVFLLYSVPDYPFHYFLMIIFLLTRGRSCQCKMFEIKICQNSKVSSQDPSTYPEKFTGTKKNFVWAYMLKKSSHTVFYTPIWSRLPLSPSFKRSWSLFLVKHHFVRIRVCFCIAEAFFLTSFIFVYVCSVANSTSTIFIPSDI